MPDLETFKEAFEPHRADVGADVQNYTDIAPIAQMSEVIA
ncbi:conserved hypothetical protein [Mycobacterium tuberculosis]|nr:conserved hypothetical protein [Mycobacterium tuberculosis]